MFPNARYVFGAAEFDFWNKGENVREARKFNRELYVKIVVPLANRATMIKPGDTVVPGITAVDAFGHSPGMLAFMIESDGKRMLNWADTAGQYVVSLQRPDLHLDVDDDKEKAVATRKRILDMVANDGLFVAGFHMMPFPGLGYVENAAAAPTAGCRTAIRLNLRMSWLSRRGARVPSPRSRSTAATSAARSFRRARHCAGPRARLRRAAAMARNSRGGVQARNAASTSFLRVKCTGGAPRIMANSIESPSSTASFILCRLATWRIAAETIAAGEEPPARALPNSFSTSRVLPAKAASMTPSSASAEASATTAITSASSMRSLPCA